MLKDSKLWGKSNGEFLIPLIFLSTNIEIKDGGEDITVAQWDNLSCRCRFGDPLSWWRGGREDKVNNYENRPQGLKKK